MKYAAQSPEKRRFIWLCLQDFCRDNHGEARAFILHKVRSYAIKWQEFFENNGQIEETGKWQSLEEFCKLHNLHVVKSMFPK